MTLPFVPIAAYHLSGFTGKSGPNPSTFASAVSTDKQPEQERAEWPESQGESYGKGDLGIRAVEFLRNSRKAKHHEEKVERI